MFLNDNYLYRSAFDFIHTKNQEQDVCVFDSHAGRWKIWMHSIVLATSFTLVALIMHTDKLLLDSDLLFQKAGGNVQHTLLIEWSSCTLMKWAGKILPFFFFDILFCMCNVYISTSEELTWFESQPEAGNQTKSFPFCPSYGLFYLRQDEALQRQRASFVSISNWQQEIHLKSNCRQLLFKRNSPFGYTSKNKRPHLSVLRCTDTSFINLNPVNHQYIFFLFFEVNI